MSEPPIDIRNPEHRDLDLKKEGKRSDLTLNEVDHHSETWAAIAKPFAQFVFGLLALVVVLPFFVMLAMAFHAGAVEADLLERIVDWAKTVLAPTVGFGSAVVGYYFGTRNSSTATSRLAERPTAEEDGEERQ